MARRSEVDLDAAWRALSGRADGDGWRTIRISNLASALVLAGRHFPGNEEAVLFGFNSINLPPNPALPRGQGFTVRKVTVELNDRDRVWIALAKEPKGNLELFKMMAEDVVETTETLSASGEERTYQGFLARVRAWQDFMQKGTIGILGLEAEVGLFGELVFLRSLLVSALSVEFAVDAWVGPQDGTHDFVFGTGAVEIKTTLSPVGFPARISSMEQLDDSTVRPLFLAGIRLTVGTGDVTLPRLVEELRTLLASEIGASLKFENLLLQAGLLPQHWDQYTRRFQHVSSKFLPVVEGFPRLIRSNVSPEIVRVRYEVDIEQVSQQGLTFAEMLNSLGVV